MQLVALLPVLAGIVFVGFALANTRPGIMRRAWLVPACAAALFFAFSLAAIIVEGPTGFWIDHTRNLWGNQIWFDLLLSTSIGWVLIVPTATAAGMRPVLWLPVVAGTGSIGFLAMLARLLYLREQNQPQG